MSGSTLHTSDNIQPPQAQYEDAPNKAHLDADPKDERSLANRLSAAQKKHDAKESDNPDAITDPLAPARSHRNKPSRGAEIDAEIQTEEEELLKKKMD